MNERVFWVDIHYACFGIASENNIIKEAPPIADWMIGRTLQYIKPFLIRNQAKVIELLAKAQ